MSAAAASTSERVCGPQPTRRFAKLALFEPVNWEFVMAQELDHTTRHHHPARRRFEKIGGAEDMMTLGLIIALGIAMLVGIVTASGQMGW